MTVDRVVKNILNPQNLYIIIHLKIKLCQIMLHFTLTEFRILEIYLK